LHLRHGDRRQAWQPYAVLVYRIHATLRAALNGIHTRLVTASPAGFRNTA
jgi:hypothetical protein